VVNDFQWSSQEIYRFKESVIVQSGHWDLAFLVEVVKVKNKVYIRRLNTASIFNFTISLFILTSTVQFYTFTTFIQHSRFT
jgi:hypothetical protein